MLNKIFHQLFLSCKEATLYMELKESNQLNLLQSFRFKIHLLICKYCKIYQKQRTLIHQYLLKETKSLDDTNDEVKKIEELKTRISNTLFKEN